MIDNQVRYEWVNVSSCTKSAHLGSPGQRAVKWLQ